MLWVHDVSNLLEYKPSLKVTDHQQKERPRIYTRKKVLPTEGFKYGGLPCAKKSLVTLAVSLLSGSEN